MAKGMTRLLGACALSAMAAGAWGQDVGDPAARASEVVAAERPADPLERRTGRGGTMRQATPHLGEMMVEMAMPAAVEEAGEGAPEDLVTEVLRFEPWQMLDEMFLRDDVVYVMRHGPTDWSKLDVKDVGSTDCDNQRILSPEGERQMREMGTLMAANDVLPGRIVVSEWCRNQQTLEALLEGFDLIDPALRDTIPVETDAGLNLLLSLQGAEDVTALRERVASWDGPGEGDAEGPLLLITHFTNIEEMTTFTVYEGEMLVLDPDRNNRVLGYLRLASAAPDVGHFDVEAGTGD